MADLVQFYKDQFDVKKYAEAYISDANYELKTYPEEFFHRMFTIEELSGRSLLDVGSGATVRGVISASSRFTEIYLSDLLDSARTELNKWIRAEPDALDFTWQFKHVARIEGHTDHKRLEERVRKVIKGILPCNILESNPLHPQKSSFDVVTSSFCLDCLKKPEDYSQALKNIVSLLRPGGCLLLVGSIGCKRYAVGGVDFPSTDINMDFIRKAIIQAGLKTIEITERYYEEKLTVPCEEKGVFTLLAKKRLPA